MTADVQERAQQAEAVPVLAVDVMRRGADARPRAEQRPGTGGLGSAAQIAVRPGGAVRNRRRRGASRAAAPAGQP